MPDRTSLAIVTSWIRWGAVALSLAVSLIGSPGPISRIAALAVTLAIVLYNAPIAFVRRLPEQLVEPAIVLALAGDLLACVAWLLLNANDPSDMTFLIFIVAAIEVPVFYRWRGALGFITAFLLGSGVQYWLRAAVFGFGFSYATYVLRSSIVLLVAAASAVLSAEISRLRAVARDATDAVDRERETLRQEATERQRAEDARRAREEQLGAIVRNAPVMIYAVDRQGVITLSEGIGLTALGKKPGESVGFSVWELYAHQPAALEKIREALLGKTVQVTMDEAGRSFAVSYAPFRDGGGAVVGVVGVALDVTERKQAERALREQTDLYEALLKAQSDLGDLVFVSEGGPAVYANPAASQITGYSPGELMALPSIYELVPLPERNALMERLEAHGRPGDVHWFETTFLDQAGRRVDVEAAQIVSKIGDRLRVFTIARDISERKRVQEELRESFEKLRAIDRERRALLSRLVNAQEDERRKIASDIHDDSIQSIYAVKIRLHLLQAQLKDPEQLNMLAQLDRTVEHAITRLRHLLFELRPLSLDEEGLTPALRLYLEEMRAEAGVDYDVESDVKNEPAAETSVILYRIAQEVLTNVRKHARASRVKVSLQERDAGIFVSIQDNGKGFAVDEIKQPRPGHLGVVAIRERAEMVGGWLRLYSSPGTGTLVEFWVPAEPVRHSEAA